MKAKFGKHWPILRLKQTKLMDGFKLVRQPHTVTQEMDCLAVTSSLQKSVHTNVHNIRYQRTSHMVGPNSLCNLGMYRMWKKTACSFSSLARDVLSHHFHVQWFNSCLCFEFSSILSETLMLTLKFMTKFFITTCLISFFVKNIQHWHSTCSGEAKTTMVAHNVMTN